MRARYTYHEEATPLEPLDTDLLRLSPICQEILFRRGYRTSEDIRNLLDPSLGEACLPLCCQDIVPALDILERAVREQLPVVVYRDYDVDGITAGAVAVEALRHLDVPVQHYVNDRSADGFGICRHGIDVILERWPETQILLTVDNGIVGHKAIDYANQRGLTVVVTDHHKTDETLPNAAAVVDLKRPDETQPYRDLCGCGLIFRVMLDLYRRLDQDISPVLQMLDMVALATVADIVPLVGENRALVRAGLEKIQEGQRPIFRALCQLLDCTDVTAHQTLAYQFAPLLNALSRMEQDTTPALEAFLSTDEAQAWQNVSEFRQLNEARKLHTRTQCDLALSMVDPQQPGQLILLRDERFEEGIAGIVAGRLKEEFNRPVIVLTTANDGSLRGSCRSVDGFDIKAALDVCASLLTVYGGHPKAAGLTLPAEQYEAFAQQMTELADTALSGVDLRPCVSLDAILTEEQLTESLVRELRVLEPYGEGFPEPIFGLRARPDGVRYMGKEQQHVKLTCSRSGLAIIGWNQADRIRSMLKLPTKFVGRPSLNTWNGRTSVQFIMET